MNYKKKYLKYKQKYKTIKYGGASSPPPPPPPPPPAALTPPGDIPQVAQFPSSAAALTTDSKDIPQVPPPTYSQTLDEYKPAPQYKFNLEEYETTMNLFYELSQLNLKAEKLHQEILEMGLPFYLNYEPWTWTVIDNIQYLSMNQYWIKDDEQHNKTYSINAKSRIQTKAHGLDPRIYSRPIKKSNFKFAFFTIWSRNYDSLVLNAGDYTIYYNDYINNYHNIKKHSKETFIEIIDRMKAHHELIKVFLTNYDIDIPRFYEEDTQLKLGDFTGYLLDYNLQKRHPIPTGIFNGEAIDKQYWNETQYEWLRKLNNFFMYEKKKEVFESYCNLRSCDIRDLME